VTDLPERLLSGSTDDWARSLLESAELDTPSPEFKRAFRRSLGVALGTTGVLTVSGTSHAAVSAAWLKWLAVGFVLGTAGAGTTVKLVEWREASRAEAPARVDTVQVAGKRATRTPASAKPEPTSGVSGATTPAPVAQSTVEADTGAKAATVSANRPTPVLEVDRSEPGAPKTTTLSIEMTRLEAVHVALARGDARSALRELDAYQESFSSGALSVEARVLRIEALTALGDHLTARMLAQRFLSEQPDSPYAKRVASHLLPASGTNP